MSKTSWGVLVGLLLVLPICFADDQFKPYLHKPSIPDAPKAKLYGKYSTNLFPGAATYSYEIEVPKGTNNLQPSLSISYNSQSMKERPSFLGAGWSLPQNYVMRHVNFTLSNTTDDYFVLVLNSANYELIFDASDRFYHTETETYAKIENLSTSSNNKTMYWLVTLKDGTKLRFGYNPDAELVSNSGYSYALKWYLDQIEDTHGNKIFYSYLKNPFSEDSGAVYLNQILYNNDQKRKIAFSYDSFARLDRRMVVDQGNYLEESHKLKDIYVFFNETLVRRYSFNFTNLERSISSLSSIAYIGSDNLSTLNSVSFSYYVPISGYMNVTNYNISYPMGASGGFDYGVRLVDLNADGLVDVIKADQHNGLRVTQLNTRNSWANITTLIAPTDFVSGSNFTDQGVRLIDFNGDGFPDMLRGQNNIRNAWLNNITRWDDVSLEWASPIDFVDATAKSLGIEFVDFNGDGKTDILQSKEPNPTFIRTAWLNTGTGWKNVSDTWIPPRAFIHDDGKDYGTRLVDFNGDGLVDILVGWTSPSGFKEAWLNTGSGWTNVTAQWAPPVNFRDSSAADTGVRLVDVNNDGLVDIQQDFNGTINKAWINNGTGWVSNDSWDAPLSFTLNGINVGLRLADVNGDSFSDIVVGENGKPTYTMVRNVTYPYLLKNITTEFGGKTLIEYDPSTKFNNSGEDGISDMGFNLFVVDTAIQENGLNDDFKVKSNTTYVYQYGFFDFNKSEFRGFNIVNETLSDNSTIVHYFHQNKQLKGKEFKTETYNKSSALFLKTENNFNSTPKSNGIFKVHLGSTASYQYDGNSQPRITNVSFSYDNYSNLIEKINYGDTSISGDEKYENYSYAYNTTAWILDKQSWYILFDFNFNKIRESKFFYDNSDYGAPPRKGDLTKTEQYLDTGSGNPTTRYEYDDFGNVIRQIDPLGRVSEFEYGLMDPTFTYLERATNALGHKVDFTYDIFGNVLTETKNGITKYNTYDVFGRISKEILPYDSSDLPTKTYTYTFDGLTPEVIKISQKTTSNNTLDSFYYYDGFANLVQIKSSAENGQQVVKNLLYDGLFRVREEQNPYFATLNSSITPISASTNKTRYQYDALSRITQVINPDGTRKTTNYNISTIMDYDENNNKHAYILDAFDRIIEVKEFNTDFYIRDNETYNTTYSYNGADELTGIRDTNGNIFNFSYDSLGRKTRLNDPDLGIWTYKYDLINNLINQTDNRGNAVLIGYDSLNRIQHKNATNQSISFAYDKQYQGTLSNLSVDNVTYNYEYDDRLRVTKEFIKLRHENFETGIVYDSMDRILEKRLPNSTEFEYIYNQMGKLNEIKGFINQTSYNAFGNPLNRTYLNNKVTTFDYYSDNARLRQIKTNSIQQLNYTYDSVGNIVSINDSINNRTYRMSYDNLDRLTNVTINGFSWVYTFDPIGNILKIVRNSTETTSLKYSGIPHAPFKVITKNTSIDVYEPVITNLSNRTQLVRFFLVNEKNASISKVNWTVEFGDGSSVTGNGINLTKGNYTLVTVERNYTRGGNYLVNITGRANTSATDIESLTKAFGTLTTGMTVLKQNATLSIIELDALNSITDLSQNWGWNCSHSVVSTKAFNMSSGQALMVIIEHNYTLNGEVNFDCRINSTDGNQSKYVTFTFPGIKIEQFNSTKIDTDTIRVKFSVKNYYSVLNNIIWNVTANGQRFNGTISSLAQGQTTSITQDVNLTNGGLKQLKVTITQGNFTDSYSEYHFVNWLTLNDFYNTIKNGTTRVLDFIITNENNLNTSMIWNSTQPNLLNSTSLGNNESLIVIIEENYAQGAKDTTIKVFNKTLEEDKLIDVFTIKHVEIEKFETVYETNKRAITSSIIKNNIDPRTISWILNNNQSVISSTLNATLNTSQKMIVIIESNYSSSGVYPTNFQINSSTFNDNKTGVSVT